jgi:hypothetical protein
MEVGDKVNTRLPDGKNHISKEPEAEIKCSKNIRKLKRCGLPINSFLLSMLLLIKISIYSSWVVERIQ